jgi:hypothetical protein
MLNLAYFKRKSAAINDENAIEESYAPSIPYLSYPQKEQCQSILDTQIPNELDWGHYIAKVEALPRTPNRFNLNPQFWNNHQAIRQREMFDPIALRRKIRSRYTKSFKCPHFALVIDYSFIVSGDPFLSLFSTHERYRYRILNEEGEPCPPFSCEYNHGERRNMFLCDHLIRCTEKLESI